MKRREFLTRAVALSAVPALPGALIASDASREVPGDSGDTIREIGLFSPDPQHRYVRGKVTVTIDGRDIREIVQLQVSQDSETWSDASAPEIASFSVVR